MEGKNKKGVYAHFYTFNVLLLKSHFLLSRLLNITAAGIRRYVSNPINSELPLILCAGVSEHPLLPSSPSHTEKVSCISSGSNTPFLFSSRP